MLFRTIYGPELESVFLFLTKYGSAEQEKIFNFFGGVIDGSQSSTTNLEDTLAFLETANLIYEKNKVWKTTSSKQGVQFFRTTLLRRLRDIQIKKFDMSSHELDPYFMGLVDELFIKPNIMFRNQLHYHINNLNLPVPCSEEKVNAWRRVLEYLGLGVRGYGGLLVQYNENLIMNIISLWNEKEGPIQHFLEEHLEKYLPWKTQRGDVANALIAPLESLEVQGKIMLTTKQDLPSKSYLGMRKVKWIRRGNL